MQSILRFQDVHQSDTPGRGLRRYLAASLLIGLAGGLSACAVAPAQQAVMAAPVIAAPVVAPPAPRVVSAAPTLTGMASWYRTGRRLRRTYSGALLDNNALTAASAVFPMGTVVRVGLARGSRSVVVTVNDRMPRNHRLIDVSEIAARELGLMGCGVAPVTVTPIELASAP
jgi:rare lipoprotein A (peptidoglycan hydrolase)